MPFATDGIIGADLDAVSTTAQFALGQTCEAEDGRRYMYCRANGALDQYDAVIIDELYDAIVYSNTTSAAAFGQPVGVAEVAVADNEYFWACIEGKTQVNVLANAAANAVLNGTATDGTLDDDGTVGSEDADGVVLTTANGGATAAVECWLRNPRVGATN